MSYNITSIKLLKLDACIDIQDIETIKEQFGDELPEHCFIWDLKYNKSVKCPNCGKLETGNFCSKCGTKIENPVEPVKLPNLWWGGCGSSNFEYMIPKIAEYIHGEVQGIAIWEGGNSLSGFAIKDGKFTTCEIVQSLKLPEGW